VSALAIQAGNVGRTFAVRRGDPVVALRILDRETGF
jgi:hypothetical protein